MTSNDDLMGFLLKMEDKRANDREADRQEMKEQREKERQEDKEEIVKVIDKCLGEKVLEAIEPFKEKTLAVEKAQCEMKEQVKVIMQEMTSLKEKLSGGCEAGNSDMAVTMATIVSRGQTTSDQQRGTQLGSGRPAGEVEYKELVSLSRRTVGLHRIDDKDLKRMRQKQYGGATNEEEEKVLAAMEFLRLETKIDSNTLDRMEIERVFAPAKQDPQCLYVTFKHVSSVSRIFEKTRCMRKESRILAYFPTRFFSRFEAVSDIGRHIREEEKCQTRIKMGLTDIQLFKKDRGVGKWELVPLDYENLPAVDLRSVSSRAESGSPAPGRPSQGRGDKRGRQSSGSSSDQNTPKVAKPGTDSSDQEDGEGYDDDSAPIDKGVETSGESAQVPGINQEEAWRKTLEKAELVGE